MGKTLSLVKALSLFYATLYREIEYLDGALERNYHFLKVLQKVMCYHYRLFPDNFHAIYCLAFYCETSILIGNS